VRFGFSLFLSSYLRPSASSHEDEGGCRVLQQGALHSTMLTDCEGGAERRRRSQAKGGWWKAPKKSRYSCCA